VHNNVGVPVNKAGGMDIVITLDAATGNVVATVNMMVAATAALCVVVAAWTTTNGELAAMVTCPPIAWMVT